MHKNGHFSSPKIIISFLTVCLSKMSSILGGTLMHNCKILGSIPRVGIYLSLPWSCFPLFFPGSS